MPTMKYVLCAALLVALQANAAIVDGRVVGVPDGNTVTVLDTAKTRHKIKLAGIDAPDRKQAYGMRSRQSLSYLAFGKKVTVETGERDKRHHEVGKVLVNGRDANLEQVTRGLAWHDKAYEREQSPNDRELYAAAEKQARAARRGLWAEAKPMPPWEFRHKGK
jgi:endonuclease YncB( thermonuclease family)